MKLTTLCEANRFKRSLLHRQWLKEFERLPKRVQEACVAAFRKWRKDNDSIPFMNVTGRRDLWKVELPHSYRSIGVENGDTIKWVFIGTHQSYDEEIKQLIKGKRYKGEGLDKGGFPCFTSPMKLIEALESPGDLVTRPELEAAGLGDVFDAPDDVVAESPRPVRIGDERTTNAQEQRP